MFFCPIGAYEFSHNVFTTYAYTLVFIQGNSNLNTICFSLMTFYVLFSTRPGAALHLVKHAGFTAILHI